MIAEGRVTPSGAGNAAGVGGALLEYSQRLSEVKLGAAALTVSQGWGSTPGHHAAGAGGRVGASSTTVFAAVN